MSPESSLPSPRDGRFFPFQPSPSAVEYTSVAALTVYHRHARAVWRDRQLEQIAASIASFGFVSPLVVDEDGMLIAGHGRLEAARSLGFASVPVVRLAHLDDQQIKALRLADNQLAALAGWDEELLALEFEDLLAAELDLCLDFDLTITGFTSAEIDGLVQGAVDPADAEDDDLAALAADGPPVSRLGDVWDLGEHRIVCGDAVLAGSYELLMAGDSAAMGIHDFPYNVPIAGHVSSTGKHGEFVMACGEMSPAQFTDFLRTVLQHTGTVLRPGALQYGFMDWRHMGELLGAGTASGHELINLCIWNKGCGGMGSFYRSQHELVFVFKVPGAAHQNHVQLGRFGRNRTNVWDVPGGAAAMQAELALHATPKPVALIAEAIRDCTARNELVLDGFSGSGTTIIAAERTGRRARVLELDPRYVDVSVRRWQRETGREAVHGSTGMTFLQVDEHRTAERPALAQAAAGQGETEAAVSSPAPSGIEVATPMAPPGVAGPVPRPRRRSVG